MPPVPQPLIHSHCLEEYETLLVPKHKQEPAILSLDVTLQERIRSLLLSRNEKCPPTTPAPSLDLVYLSHRAKKTPVGNSLAPPRTYSVSSNKTDRKQETRKSHNEVMGASRFDGPAAQFDDSNSTHSRRRSTNADMYYDRSSMVEEERASTVHGVNDSTPEDLIGRKLSVPDGLRASKSSSLKRPTLSRTPQISYTLRTIAPNAPKASDNRFHATVKPDPDGFHSGIDHLLTAPVRDDALDDKKYHHGPPGSAVDALHNIQGHDSRTTGNPLLVHHSTSPEAVANAATSTRPPQSLLGNPPDAPPTTGQETGSTSARYENPSIETRRILANEPDKHDRHATTKDRSPDFGGVPLDEILANLPPTSDRSSTVVNVHPIALDTDDVAESAEAPLLTRVVSAKDEHLSKSSPVSRALSMLSSVSAKSGFRTPRRPSTAKENYIDIDKANQDIKTHCSVFTPNGGESRWYQSIVDRQSSLSLRPSNLTARPSQRKKSTAVMPPKRQINKASTDDASLMRKQQQTSESFQKVIVDLESLLNEAIEIAGQASREYSGTDPALPHMIRNGYRRLSTTDSDERSSILIALDDKQNLKAHAVVVQPDDEDLYHGHFTKARDATPFPRSLAATRHQSAVPPYDAEENKQGQSTLSTGGSKTTNSMPERNNEPMRSADWAVVRQPTRQVPKSPEAPAFSRAPNKEQHSFLIRDRGLLSETSGYTGVSGKAPQIQPRISSKRLQRYPTPKMPSRGPAAIISSEESVSTSGPYVADFKNSALQYHPVYQEAMAREQPLRAIDGSKLKEDEGIAMLRSADPQSLEQGHSHPTRDEIIKGYSLRGRHHFEIREPHGFSLSRAHRRAPIARDWGVSRKRFVATTTCLNTALLGLIIGIYAGEVPAIQYAVADDHHVVILGNVVFFLGLAVTTALFWPLPLLHGRKPYTMAALTILLPLLFPQALAINSSRSPYVVTYRVGLLVPRAIAGLVVGFAHMNSKTTLLDLFGASLQSGNPHQEVVDEYDVRRHGGGMGVWLGIWTWCWIGSIGIGFWVGASIISGLNVAWGFWILIILTSTVLVLNVLTPEVRRSAYRRSMAEVRSGTDVSRRIARGEIKMHLDSTGPLWWWEEVWAGHVLCIRMLKQPGFAVLAFYLGWIYGQVVLVIVVSEKRPPPQ